MDLHCANLGHLRKYVGREGDGSITSLSLERIGDDFFRSSLHLPNLKELQLDASGVSDAGLAGLIRFQSLEDLALRHTSIGDAGLVHVGRLRNLHYLRLEGTNVTGAGMSELTNLKSLEWLFLLGTKVDDSGLLALSKLPWLETLDLRATRVTDVGVKMLENGFPKLTSLTLSRDNTNVSFEALASLRRVKPICKIELWPPPEADADDDARVDRILKEKGHNKT